MSKVKTESDLVYAAFARCRCGAGLAYPRGASATEGAWECSDVLLGRVTPGQPGAVEHDPPRPFIFWEIKSELQPSANGATTRPQPLNAIICSQDRLTSDEISRVREAIQAAIDEEDEETEKR